MSTGRVIIERTLFIAAAPETVFRFLVDPALMAQWIGLSHKLGPAPGGTFRVEVSRGNVAVGVFTEVTPHRRVAFTWGWESADAALASLKPGTSLVTIELEAKDEGTLLRLRHSGLPEDLERIHGDRWSHYLSRLVQAVPPSGHLASSHREKAKEQKA
ncbi:MAG TPA: SRPBCC family protein [Candidatus Acidoferrum sp.]|nr:SRPBCC family protein [Candidatus Methylomirabilis sp.]HWU39577.1 SRPBCC family protein [Candidatus Acidoferrum sp.]